MEHVWIKRKLLEPISLDLSQGDVTFTCNDTTVLQRYHQCVLASHSKFLEELLAERSCCMCKSSCGFMDVSIILDGFSPEVLTNLMLYIYTGRCTLKSLESLEEVRELSNVLSMKLEIGHNEVVNKQTNSEATVRINQKRITLAIMSTIEKFNSGIAKTPCLECAEILQGDSFMLHYRNHMQAVSQPSMKQNSTKSSTAEHNTDESKSVDGLNHYGVINSLKNDDSENFSDYLKNKLGLPLVKEEPMEKEDIDETDCLDNASLNSVGIDMEEYEKLLRSSIHTLILNRKRKRARALNESDHALILVSQQEIDEEILKNPRNKVEDYGKLKVRHTYRKIYDRKLKLKSRTDKDPISVTDEEIQEELDKENESRSNKIFIDVKKVKSGRSKSSTSLKNVQTIPDNDHKPLEIKSPTDKNEQESSIQEYSTSTSPRRLGDKEKKKIYHRLYVRKWNKNQASGLTTPIHVSEEEIMNEFLLEL